MPLVEAGVLEREPLVEAALLLAAGEGEVLVRVADEELFWRVVRELLLDRRVEINFRKRLLKPWPDMESCKERDEGRWTGQAGRQLLCYNWNWIDRWVQARAQQQQASKHARVTSH